MVSPDRTRELVALASEAVMRVREVDPERNGAWIASLSPTDQRDLIITLAAMVDPSVPLPVALGWTDSLVVGGD